MRQTQRMKWRVLVSSPQIQPHLDLYRTLLKDEGIEIEIYPTHQMMNEAQLLDVIEDFDGVISSDDEFTQRVLERAKKLKVIAKWGTGLNSIDLRAAAHLGIAVRNTPSVFSDAVADVTLGYVILLARHLHTLDSRVRNSEWPKMTGLELRGRILGIIGIGNIGKQIVRRALPFGLHVVGNDTKEVPASFIRETGVQMTSLAKLLRSSDFVSIACDQNPTSYHLIGKQELAMMNPHAFLINTARGPIVDGQALVEALEKESIAGAALDVFEEEPLSTVSKLRTFTNCILAPHNAYNTGEAAARVHENTIRSLIEELKASEELE